MFGWATDDLPADKQVHAAWLRLFIGDTWIEDDQAYLSGDWYGWGPECDAGDAVAPVAHPALASCGTDCSLAAMGPMKYRDLPLGGAATHVARGAGARTELRLALDSPALCGPSMLITGVSEVQIIGPGLVLHLCDPTPSPTPEPTATPAPP